MPVEVAANGVVYEVTYRHAFCQSERAAFTRKLSGHVEDLKRDVGIENAVLFAAAENESLMVRVELEGASFVNKPRHVLEVAGADASPDVLAAYQMAEVAVYTRVSLAATLLTPMKENIMHCDYGAKKAVPGGSSSKRVLVQANREETPPANIFVDMVDGTPRESVQTLARAFEQYASPVEATPPSTRTRRGGLRKSAISQKLVEHQNPSTPGWEVEAATLAEEEEEVPGQTMATPGPTPAKSFAPRPDESSDADSPGKIANWEDEEEEDGSDEDVATPAMLRTRPTATPEAMAQPPKTVTPQASRPLHRRLSGHVDTLLYSDEDEDPPAADTSSGKAVVQMALDMAAACSSNDASPVPIPVAPPREEDDSSSVYSSTTYSDSSYYTSSDDDSDSEEK